MGTRSKRSHDAILAEDENLLDESSSQNHRNGKDTKQNEKYIHFLIRIFKLIFISQKTETITKTSRWKILYDHQDRGHKS